MPELSKPLVDAVERYLSQTPVVTFTYARKATNQLERVFWICFILVMGAFTGQDLVSQFQRYLSEPTTGSVVVMHNTSFSFPDASFCLTINVSRLQYGLDPRNETAVRELLSSLDDTPDILAYLRKHVSPRAGQETEISNYKNKSFLTKFLENKLASQNLEPNPQYPFPLIRHRSLLSLTVAMLNSIVRAENTVVNEKLANFTHWGILGPVGKRPGPKLAPRPSTARSIEMIQQFYLQRNIDFTDLMKSVGAAVCSQLQPFIYSKTKNLTTMSNLYRLADPCAPDLFRWLGPSPITQVNNKEMFCYALPEKLMNMYTDRDKIVFGFTSSNLYSDPDDLSADDGDNEESAYFNLVDDDNSNKCNIPVRKTSRVDISVHGHFLSVNRRRYPCGEKDLSECRFRCRAKYILRSCGCYPISMEFILGLKPANLPFCGEGVSNHSMAVPFPNENSPACQLIWALLDPDAACVAKCTPACEYMIFQYGWDGESSEEDFMTFLPADEARNATVFVIRVGKFVYPKVIEDFAMDAKTFTAAIGGVASFWLGLSLVALAHLLAFVVTSIIECRNRNGARSEQTFSEQAVSVLKDRESDMLKPELKRVCGCGRSTVTIGEKEYSVFQPTDSSPPVYFRRLGRKAVEDNDDFYDKIIRAEDLHNMSNTF